MPRSLFIRTQAITLVKSCLLRNGFPSQKLLAEELGIAQSTVSNFLNGKPVDYVNFVEICRVLGQEWRDIADFQDNFHPQEVQSKIGFHILISESSLQLQLIQKLQAALIAAHHHVSLSEKNTPLNSSLQKSDYWLLLLSPELAMGEILLEDVRHAKELHQITPQKPAILPICLDLDTPLSFDLIELLQGIQVWQWHSTENSSILISEILQIFTESRTSLPANHQFAVDWNVMRGMGGWRDVGMEKKLTIPISETPLPVAAPELPEGQVELISHFYINRPPIESLCYETISQPGALIRIKAPRQMGKTSLMARILHHAEKEGSQTMALSLQLANQRVFANSDTFLQWFCASISMELGLLNTEQLTKYAQLAEIIGSNQSCKAYFEQYLLPEIPTSLTLGLDEVDRVFESPEIADDFFGLLRSLHEEAKRRDIWKKLRLVVVHSTEVYIPLDVNKSPFNVGLPIELPEFNAQQLEELAQRHRLKWKRNEVEKLMALVGGHPYLIRLAMYRIARQTVTLEELLAEGATEAGIYRDHLRRHLWNLEKYPELILAMREVVRDDIPVRLPSIQGFKLNSMGLVKLEGNHCTPRCKLYQEYFGDSLLS
ncbi:MAG TPA: molecular chaperone Tir [Cyanobacteria bacterium UBA11149]|nr:molecular chaperone Tir [Cyanobacteria bacterium UBA11367]HBE59205.1 molecular chaperone Tir [Cyanobacteria bacterium UBA11366]HBR73175.1 molecular chaperone Tir [Cyanobacteria bacterium UBA11159]HBS69351.1 molecular chaperone Tir [Cyanobacteria bacterium UBA11153]HBW88547.1 molecular chaperone Tir [Cyanobacteria bacterium UBA11149]HCA93567.1 molecular chaperone Tir [Cyanobacteria bacterium UBA9226]